MISMIVASPSGRGHGYQARSMARRPVPGRGGLHRDIAGGGTPHADRPTRGAAHMGTWTMK